MKIIYLLLFVVSFSAQGSDLPKGGLPKEMIDARIKSKIKDILACYANDPVAKKSPGRISTAFKIDGTGKVTEAKVEKSTLENLAVENCVLDVLRALEFPKPMGGGTVDVSYPFSFAPTKPAAVKGV